MAIDELEAFFPSGRRPQRNEDNFVSWIGDDAAGVGVNALEKVVVALGIGDQHVGYFVVDFAMIPHIVPVQRFTGSQGKPRTNLFQITDD
jgi:hypothetical protein